MPLAFLEKVYPSTPRFFWNFSEVAHKKGALSLTYRPCGRAPTVLDMDKHVAFKDSKMAISDSEVVASKSEAAVSKFK